MDQIELVERSVKQEALSIPQEARKIVVVDQVTFSQADSFFGVIKAMRKKINQFFDPMIEEAKGVKAKAEEHRKSLANRKDEADRPLVEAESYITGQLSAFTRKREEDRRLEQLRLEAIARKEEEDRRILEATLLEAMGEHEAADEIIREPVFVPPPIVEKAPAAKNFTYREHWTYRITDVSKLPLRYMMPDEVMIGAEVRRNKGATDIPGVQVWDEGTISKKAGM